jgi:hypothetical protein
MRSVRMDENIKLRNDVSPSKCTVLSVVVGACILGLTTSVAVLGSKAATCSANAAPSPSFDISTGTSVQPSSTSFVANISTPHMTRSTASFANTPRQGSTVWAGSTSIKNAGGGEEYSMRVEAVKDAGFGHIARTKTALRVVVTAADGSVTIFMPLDLDVATILQAKNLTNARRPKMLYMQHAGSSGKGSFATFLNLHDSSPRTSAFDATLQADVSRVLDPMVSAYFTAGAYDGTVAVQGGRRRLSEDAELGGDIGGDVGGYVGGKVGSDVGSDVRSRSSQPLHLLPPFLSLPLSPPSSCLHPVPAPCLLLASADGTPSRIAAAQVGGDVGEAVGGAVGGAIGSLVGPEGTALGADIGGAIGSEVGKYVGGKVGGDVGKDLGSSIGSDVGSDIGGDVGGGSSSGGGYGAYSYAGR